MDISLLNAAADVFETAWAMPTSNSQKIDIAEIMPFVREAITKVQADKELTVREKKMLALVLFDYAAYKKKKENDGKYIEVIQVEAIRIDIVDEVLDTIHDYIYLLVAQKNHRDKYETTYY